MEYKGQNKTMSKSLTTNNIAAVLAVIGLVFATVFAFATPAKAQTIADLQAQIQALLAQLTALQGGSTAPSASCTTFTRNHSQGDSGGEVMAIQKFLNSMAGTQLATSGAGSPGNETSYFGSITKAGVIKFQNMYAADILAPVGLSAGTGYWGPSSRAKANALCAAAPIVPGPGVPGVPITGNGLKVMLASDSPVNVALVAGQAIGELAKFTFSNPTGSDINVTNLSFKRIGVSNDATLSDVYLYQGAARITDSGGITSGTFSFNNTAGVFTVPANGTVTISVRSNIAASTSGEQVGVQLNSVASSGALDTSVVLPITGGIQTISSATIGTVALTYTGPDGATDNPADEVRVFEGSTVVSTPAANLHSVTFENRGTSSDGDLRNFKLYVDGVQVGATMGQTVKDRVTFDLSASPTRLETGTRIIKVLADIVGGSSYTYDIRIRRAADINVVDAELGQPILMTGTFAAGTGNTIAAGTLSIAKSADSPNTDIAVSATNVLMARFEVRAAGEDVKVEAVKLWVDQGAAGGMDNGKVFLNGTQIGSTKDVAAGGTEFTFGSSFIARHGQTEIVEIYGDAKTTAAVNFAAATTVDVGISVAAADTEGLSSGNTVTAISEVEGNSRTMTASSLSASKASGYGDQTMIAGTNNAKLGSFTLSAGSTEGININSIVVNLTSNESATITDLRLVDNATGLQLGSTKPSPSTANTFSVNVTLPVSGSKTYDVVGNIKSGSNAGPWVAILDSTTGGNGAVTAQSTTIGSDVSLQTITVGSGTLTDAVGVSPDDANGVAGSSDVHVGNFKFTAQYSNFTVQELKVKVPANSATSVSAVTLKYKDAAGTIQSASAALALSTGAAQTHSTATFTGLTFYVPQNTEQNLDVYVSIPTIASGATAGRAITVLLDANEGFRAVDSSGTASTTLAAGDLNSADTSGKGTVYVRKSIPTLSSTPITSTLSNGTDQVLGRFNVTADAAGNIGWKYITFTVSKAAVDIGPTSTVKLWQGSNSIAGNLATTTGDLLGGLEAFPAAAGTDTISFEATSEQQISAGSTVTYEFRGTVANAGASDYVDVSIANPATSATTTAAYATVLNALGDADTSFIWTDRSSIATVHSETTADWTDDYLVKTLPLTIGNRSRAD